MNKSAFSFFLFFSLSLGILAQNFQLVWEDSFDGTQLDASKWAHDLGTGTQYGLWGWGNGELQCYQEENTLVSDGTLKIIAKEEPDGVADPFNSSKIMSYSSSKIITAGLFTFRYGRVQARIKTVDGQGFWPAFWMLPTGGSWPCDGEIDIMEQWGNDGYSNVTTGAAHLGPCSGGGSTYRSFSKSISSGSYADDFHVYEVRWEPNMISWYVDGEFLFRLTPESYPTDYTWPFNKGDWYLMLNLAIDKNGPSENTQFPSQIEVDWVRVYQESAEATECTDAEAYNYNSNAILDDGSCLYEVNFEVDMNCVSFIPQYVSVTGFDENVCGSGTILEEVGDSRIWTGTAYLPKGAHQYNYCADGGEHNEELLLYANEQGDWSCIASTDSTTSAKREILVDGATQVLEVWSSCTTCLEERGCIYSTATNYNSNATVQDMSDSGGLYCNFESCEKVPVDGCLWFGYFLPFAEDANRGLCQSWEGTICSEYSSEVYGCMDPKAINYNPLVTIQTKDDWGNILCTYASCDDVPDTGCKYPTAFATFHANFGAGDCASYGGTACTDASEGCLDENATNYNVDAIVQSKDQWQNLLCTYASCDDVPETGCKYPTAFATFNANFGPGDCASYGGTACIDASEGCLDENALNFNAEASVQVFDQYRNLMCTYASCDDVPVEGGCRYSNSFGPWHGSFTADDCSSYSGEPCISTSVGCKDPNASNYLPQAETQFIDHNGNLLCIYSSCKEAPSEGGCLYENAFGPWQEGFTAQDCEGYGGVSCLYSVAIEELEQSFTLVPNPSNGFFHLTTDEALEELEIFDLTGSRVYRSSFNSKNLKIDLSHLSSGSYFLKGTFLSGQSTTKSLLIYK